MVRSIVAILKYIWVSPNTLLGVLVGLIGLMTGGRGQIVRGCFEFHGGFVTWLLSKLPPSGVLAMTLGHSIIGQSKAGLAIARDHEHVHVRQYERWGPFFIPAYLTLSAVVRFQKKDAYRDNPFEVEAYNVSDPGEERRKRRGLGS